MLAIDKLRKQLRQDRELARLMAPILDKADRPELRMLLVHLQASVQEHVRREPLWAYADPEKMFQILETAMCTAFAVGEASSSCRRSTTRR